MSQILVLANALAVTATSIGDPIRLNVTPFAGGMGREALLHIDAPIGGAGVVRLEGHNSPHAEAPAEDDSEWTTVVTLNSASPRVQEIPDLPAWIRVNVATVGTGTVSARLEGTP